MTIPIYLVEAATWRDAAEKIGGDTLQRWCIAQGFGEKHRPHHLLCPSEDGSIQAVLALVEMPLTLWSCAQLATDLPPESYQLNCRYLSDFIGEDVKSDLALGWALHQYHYGRYKERKQQALPELHSSDCARQTFAPFVEAITLVRDLINTPPADMGPEELAEAAHTLAKRFSAKFHVTEGKKLAQEYPAIHAVGKGSPRAPRLIDMRWGMKDAPLVVLVGKGVCFDTGGLDMKSSANMRLMKKDMGGAAAVLGLAHLIMTHDLPIQLRVLIPAVENAVDGASFRPSDVITMRSGLTVEIGNTDAEGRLVLADALTDACAEKPELVIDLATLTGAARVALGTDIPALFATNDTMAAELQKVAKTQMDPLWQLPLFEPYAELLQSSVADCNNVSSGGYGGAITAALFLKQFITPPVEWMHIDMMAWNIKSKAGRPMGGEAMGIRALFYWLQEHYRHKRHEG